VSDTRARSGRPGLACDGRQHRDGEHECSRRFWPQAGLDDVRSRARSQGWWCACDGSKDLCPYHAPTDCARVYELIGPGAPVPEKTP
jgi:hypothetical protein